MDSESRLKVEMAVRVRNFLRANPFGDPKSDGVAEKFIVKVGRAQELMSLQEIGVREAAAARVRGADIRGFVRTVAVRHIREITKAAALEHPGLPKLFRQLSRSPNRQEFRAGLDALVALVGAHQERLNQYGMRNPFLEELKTLLTAYDQAVADADGGRRTHTGARGELKRLASELVKMARQLNGMMLYRIREKPELSGAWESARNIAWPVPKPAVDPSKQVA